MYPFWRNILAFKLIIHLEIPLNCSVCTSPYRNLDSSTWECSTQFSASWVCYLWITHPNHIQMMCGWSRWAERLWSGPLICYSERYCVHSLDSSLVSAHVHVCIITCTFCACAKFTEEVTWNILCVLLINLTGCNFSEFHHQLGKDLLGFQVREFNWAQHAQDAQVSLITAPQILIRRNRIRAWGSVEPYYGKGSHMPHKDGSHKGLNLEPSVSVFRPTWQHPLCRNLLSHFWQ